MPVTRITTWCRVLLVATVVFVHPASALAEMPVTCTNCDIATPLVVDDSIFVGGRFSNGPEMVMFDDVDKAWCRVRSEKLQGIEIGFLVATESQKLIFSNDGSVFTFSAEDDVTRVGAVSIERGNAITGVVYSARHFYVSTVWGQILVSNDLIDWHSIPLNPEDQHRELPSPYEQVNYVATILGVVTAKGNQSSVLIRRDDGVFLVNENSSTKVLSGVQPNYHPVYYDNRQLRLNDENGLKLKSKDGKEWAHDDTSMKGYTRKVAGVKFDLYMDSSRVAVWGKETNSWVSEVLIPGQIVDDIAPTRGGFLVTTFIDSSRRSNSDSNSYTLTRAVERIVLSWSPTTDWTTLNMDNVETICQ